MKAENWARYSFKALMTWGNERDFKHFLPRLLELSFDNSQLDLDWIGTKFSCLEPDWHQWPDEKIAALQSFFGP